MQSSARFELQFDATQIEPLARRYFVPGSEDEKAEHEIENELAPKIRRRGYLLQNEFLTICHWKTKRTQKRCKSNDGSLIEETTALAFSAKHERLRIETLTLLDGVAYPTASVLLHFGHPDPYPILDFRALQSLGIEEPLDYTFEFWWSYVDFCRNLAQANRVSMRTLDRALWQWSKEA